MLGAGDLPLVAGWLGRPPVSDLAEVGRTIGRRGVLECDSADGAVEGRGTRRTILRFWGALEGAEPAAEEEGPDVKTRGAEESSVGVPGFVDGKDPEAEAAKMSSGGVARAGEVWSLEDARVTVVDDEVDEPESAEANDGLEV